MFKHTLFAFSDVDSVLPARCHRGQDGQGIPALKGDGEALEEVLPRTSVTSLAAYP